MIESFTYDALPGRVVFGPGAARERLAGELHALRGEKVLLVCAEAERELADGLCGPLGDRVVATFTGVRQHVPVEVVDDVVGTATRYGADTVLTIGGGSTTGTGKAVALRTGLPLAAVPTTYAGSEMTPVWGMTEDRRKTTGRDPRVQPRLVVYDPELTVSLPPAITATSALNAMAHCVEAVYVPKANPIVTLLATEGARALAEGAPAAVADPADLAARTGTLYGAYLAGAAFAAVGGGLHHKICHVLGGAWDLPHAETHTIVLPHVAALFDGAAPGLERIAAAIGADAAGPGLFDLAERVGAPTALTAVGFDAAALDEAVERVVAELPADQPRPVGEAQVRLVLRGAVEGRRPEPRPRAIR